MEREFQLWWTSHSVDGIIPAEYIHNVVTEIYRAYKNKNFNFIYVKKDLFNRLTSFFYLLYMIDRQNLVKRIVGPKLKLIPKSWKESDEEEWQQTYWEHFDSIFWEEVAGPEKSWEHPIRRWRSELPSILQTYTVRSRDVLISNNEELEETTTYED